MLKRSVYSVLFSLSVYEAVTIQTLVLCTSKGRGYYHIWYIYMQAALQLVQVSYYYYYLYINCFIYIGFILQNNIIQTSLSYSADKDPTSLRGILRKSKLS